jgi:hypothetical protein
MKTRTIILFAILALLFISSTALAQSNGSSPQVGYAVNQGTASGGHYRLANRTCQMHGLASGGGYSLAGPAGTAGTGTPCCCSYLPVIRK